MRHLFNRAILAVLVAAPLAQGATPSWIPIDPAEAAAFRERSDPALGSMRAGQVPERPGFSDSERTALHAAEATSPELAQMRGGILGTVLAAVLIVLLVLILI